MNIDHIALFPKKRNLDVGVLAALLSEDLDAEVHIFVGGQTTVVAVDLTEKNDGRRSRSLGLTGHLQFVPEIQAEILQPRREWEASWLSPSERKQIQRQIGHGDEGAA